MSSCVHSSSPNSLVKVLVGTTLMSPSGIPARVARAAYATIENGVSGGCKNHNTIHQPLHDPEHSKERRQTGLRTHEHPTAMAGLTFFASIAICAERVSKSIDENPVLFLFTGKFQGVTNAQTPTGWRITTVLVVGLGEGMKSPLSSGISEKFQQDLEDVISLKPHGFSSEPLEVGVGVGELVDGDQRPAKRPTLHLDSPLPSPRETACRSRP